METTVPVTKSTTKLLIVEDEGEICLLLNILLNGEEMELNHVPTLVEASDYLEKNPTNILILDNKLPDGFGVDAIRFFKSRHPSLRIIMISGFDGAARDVAMENGADVYLEKPFTKSQLFEAIASLSN